MAILVVATDSTHIQSLVPWSWQIARARQEGLIIVAAKEGSESTVEDIELDCELLEQSEFICALQRVATEYVKQSSENPDISDVIIRSVTAPHLGRAVMAEVNEVDPTLLIVLAQWAKDGEERTLAQYLYARAPGAMMAVTGHAESAPSRILVPSSEGRNAREALQVAATLCENKPGRVTALYVQPNSVEAGEAVGHRVLKRAVANAGIDANPHVELKVELAAKIPDGIRRVADEYDAVLMGASERGLIYRALFGTLPDELIRGTQSKLIGVVRSRRRWGVRLQDLFDRFLHPLGAPDGPHDAYLCLRPASDGVSLGL